MACFIGFCTFLKLSIWICSYDLSHAVFFTVRISMKIRQCSTLISVTISAPDYTLS
ncbi:hypothetical protein PISMIDRAFT_679866 [Pisolithus microcarpus 441]|uniref:Uncharacterized protein n=1 Tax=Pisolithus microcarpus 441 TaxID=765257 RepID=A0A0C9YDE4_9AGAM|nr:hypothetical protein BKA83DRAFT_679866 [Pisolithus microcarpus]KIK22830.1 hypothetical protein PISMIDRAFT_679866 [Pisolithus microcarpus 441]